MPYWPRMSSVKTSRFTATARTGRPAHTDTSSAETTSEASSIATSSRRPSDA
jgi:hypothetical protein